MRKPLLIIIFVLLMAGSAWGEQGDIDIKPYPTPNYCCETWIPCSEVDSPAKYKECYWEVETVDVSKGHFEINDWLKEHPEWEPISIFFDEVKHKVWLSVKRKVCE